VKHGQAMMSRLLRLIGGSVLIILAYSGGFAGLYLALAVLGGLVLFSAVYDRCPIYKALSTRILTIFNKNETPPAAL
jgi:hypothetical protein